MSSRNEKGYNRSIMKDTQEGEAEEDEEGMLETEKKIIQFPRNPAALMKIAPNSVVKKR